MHVVIIGSGVIGTACAHYLTLSGHRVTLLERSTFASQCSRGNCGLVCPSHVLPLAVPGAISSTFRLMMKKNSPFRMKPRLSLLGWMLGFARRCNQSAMMESARDIHQLLTESRRLYAELVRDGLECEWETQGLLFVFESPEGMKHYAETDELLRKEFDTPAKPFYGQELIDLEPALKSGIAGGWLYEGDAHLRPDVLMSSWRKQIESQGAIIRENCEVQAITRSNGRAFAVQTNQGPVEADAFILAAGAMTPFLNDQLGVSIPIQPGKGYSITMPRPARCPRIPMIFEEHRVAVTPMQTGYRLGSMMEFVGYDDTIPPQRLEYLKQTAAHYLHDPYCDPVVDTWYGWRPMTPDSRPIIRRSPKLGNVVIAAGHNMLGLSMAPATGIRVRHLIDEIQHS